MRGALWAGLNGMPTCFFYTSLLVFVTVRSGGRRVIFHRLVARTRSKYWRQNQSQSVSVKQKGSKQAEQLESVVRVVRSPACSVPVSCTSVTEASREAEAAQPVVASLSRDTEVEFVAPKKDGRKKEFETAAPALVLD